MRIGIGGIGIGVAPVVAPAPPEEPGETPSSNLWPQENFDSADGLTLGGWTVSNGVATSPHTFGALIGTATATLATGRHRCEADLDGNPEGATLEVRAGGAVALTSTAASGTVSNEFNIGAVGSQDIVLRGGDGDEEIGGIRLTALRVTRVAPTITSLGTISGSTASPLSHSLLANATVTWSIRTAAQNPASIDHASFEIDGNKLEWLGGSLETAPAGGEYAVVVRATDGSGLYAEQTITVTVA
jgi:hypothetical protein